MLAAERWLARIHPAPEAVATDGGASAFAERFPRHGRRGPGPSILDSHLDHLHARHGEGCEKAAQLWRELRVCGFPGTVKQIRRWYPSGARGRPRMHLRLAEAGSVI